MKATQSQINNFLQTPNIQFVIPVYQRNYDWTNTECKELLNDIISVQSEDRGTHFIGSIVFVHEGIFIVNEVKELVIIDGQQRLTTINILYVALYRFAKSSGKSHDAERLYNMFLTNQYVKNESSKLKLKQTDTNSLAFKSILLGTESISHGFSNVIENYNYFRSVINDDNFELILNGLNRLIFVEISLERDKDDPQRIFESLNSTGLDLSQSDLIRNFILMDLPPKDQNRIFETVWSPIEENAKDLVKQNSLVSEYIRDYLTLRNKKIPNKSKVYAEFKSLYANKKDEAYQQELENIKSLSIHYKKFINPFTVADSDTKKELEYINRLEINVAYPFLLQVFEDAENGMIGKNELIKILKLIQSYAWRRFIVGLPTSALNKIFMTLYSEVDTEEYYDSLAKALIKKKGSAKFPSNEDIKTALRDKDLYNTQPKNRNYFFELLENYNNREFVDTSNEKITIEHIFPRNPNETWIEDLSSEEYFLFKEKYLNTIGNLTLSGNNGPLGNKSFLAKKEMNNDDQKQGYQFSRLWLNSYLSSLDKWDISKYEERLNIIYDRFLKIWEFPEVEINQESDLEEQNIFDAESPTNKKLEYFIFENTKVEEDTVAQMYFYVIRNLYEKNSQLLLTNQNVIKITRSEADFRAPQEVNNGWFIESNIDSNSKFSNLKKILSIFELEDELFIKFQSPLENEAEPNRFGIRKKYWQQILPLIKHKNLFVNVNPTKDHWLGTGAGIGGVSYNFIITKTHVRIELTISTSTKEKNKLLYKRLHKNKENIESIFGGQLGWEELPDNKMSRVRIEHQGVNIFNGNDWPIMNEFFILNLPKFENAFQPFIKELR
ncbi:DUF4268 domain-containing protein [Aquiflexum sp. TKW24L]|uniref:DUF4268 domain-containing protein n=1 Tax=Aquiflexum sp. TKW24L TaxID=2942212 RepID=UPI0020C18016|nr:DUF4268 domain-containing protein [Aquiflexum sp. TKW24L]MCL6259161.1 DUF4268 domain-containing protein [Aquiflexum sp. TKW24L]